MFGRQSGATLDITIPPTKMRERFGMYTRDEERRETRTSTDRSADDITQSDAFSVLRDQTSTMDFRRANCTLHARGIAQTESRSKLGSSAEPLRCREAGSTSSWHEDALTSSQRAIPASRELHLTFAQLAEGAFEVTSQASLCPHGQPQLCYRSDVFLLREQP